MNVLIQLKSRPMHWYKQDFALRQSTKSLFQIQAFPTSGHFLGISVDILLQGECFFSCSELDESLFPRKPLTKELVAHNRHWLTQAHLGQAQAPASSHMPLTSSYLKKFTHCFLPGLEDIMQWLSSVKGLRICSVHSITTNALKHNPGIWRSVIGLFNICIYPPDKALPNACTVQGAEQGEGLGKIENKWNRGFDLRWGERALHLVEQKRSVHKHHSYTKEASCPVLASCDLRISRDYIECYHIHPGHPAWRPSYWI